MTREVNESKGRAYQVPEVDDVIAFFVTLFHSFFLVSFRLVSRCVVFRRLCICLGILGWVYKPWLV